MTQPIKLHYETREIRLPAGLTNSNDIVFVGATIFDDPPLPFAIVQYELAGTLQKKGLRMDLDKRVFLGQYEDATFQAALESSAAAVAAAIGKVRREVRTASARTAMI